MHHEPPPYPNHTVSGGGDFFHNIPLRQTVESHSSQHSQEEMYNHKLSNTISGLDTVLAKSIATVNQTIERSIAHLDTSHELNALTPATNLNPCDPLRRLNDNVVLNLHASTAQILDDVWAYNRSRTDILLMFQDFQHDHHEQLMHAMEEERKEDERTFRLRESLHLAEEGDRICAAEISHLQDDILHEDSVQTDRLLAELEDYHHGSDEDSTDASERGWSQYQSVYDHEWRTSAPHEDNSLSPNTGPIVPTINVDDVDDLNETPNSEDNDDLNENTDTDDGREDLLDILTSNSRLLAFLTAQSATIRRLRRRIDRLGTIVLDLKNHLSTVDPTYIVQTGVGLRFDLPIAATTTTPLFDLTADSDLHQHTPHTGLQQNQQNQHSTIAHAFTRIPIAG